MQPSRPSSTDPNAPYRHAIAALADNRIDGQELYPDESRDRPGQNQANRLAELNPRRTINRDRLNTIARNIASHVDFATQLIANNSIPTATATTEATVSSASSITINTVCQYLHDKGYVDRNMADAAIQNRLNSVNLSAETLLTAIETVDNANHPLWATLQANDFERAELIHRLARMATIPQAFRPGIRAVIQNSNNNSEQMIANFLDYLRRLNTQ